MCSSRAAKGAICAWGEQPATSGRAATSAASNCEATRWTGWVFRRAARAEYGIIVGRFESAARVRTGLHERLVREPAEVGAFEKLAGWFSGLRWRPQPLNFSTTVTGGGPIATGPRVRIVSPDKTASGNWPPRPPAAPLAFDLYRMVRLCGEAAFGCRNLGGQRLAEPGRQCSTRP